MLQKLARLARWVLGSLREWWRERWSEPPLGLRGERAAERFLCRLRYKIVARGERGRLGELDLVAVDAGTVVFVEVKSRRSPETAPAEAVDAVKQRRLTRLAVAFLRRHDLLEYPARFDVVAVHWPAAARRPQIEHFRGAFQAVGQGQFFA